MRPHPPEVHDQEFAVRFIKWCVEQLGLGYHPDTPFSDYVGQGGQAVFAPEEARLLDELTEKAFSFCDPYDVGSQEFQRLTHQDRGK